MLKEENESMDYSRKKLQELKNEEQHRRGSIENRISMMVLRIAMIAILILGIFGALRAVGFVRKVIRETPSIRLVAQPVEMVTVIMDADRTEAGSVSLSDLTREDVALEEVPEEIRQIFVDSLDEGFYERNGFQLSALLSVLQEGLLRSRMRSEPDTITQRLIENSVYMKWASENQYNPTIERLQELIMSSRLEKKYSKDWILEHYLNSVLFGENTIGIQAASRRYFGKEVSGLTLAEGTVLAAIVGAPTDRNPINYEEANQARRLEILDRMEELGHLSSEEKEQLQEDSVYDYVTGVSPVTRENTFIDTAYGRLLKDSIIRDLSSKMGYTQEQAELIFYHGGLTVYSALDTGIQQIAEDAVSNAQNYPDQSGWSVVFTGSYRYPDGTVGNFSELDMQEWMRDHRKGNSLVFSTREEARKITEQYQNYLKKSGTPIAVKVSYNLQPQASAVVMEQSSGMVRAVVSQRSDGSTTAPLWLSNRAAEQYENSGALMDVLSVYGPALDSQSYTMSSIIEDVWVDGTYSSEGISIRNAIATQNDTAAQSLFAAITRETSLESMIKFNFSYLDLEDDSVGWTPHMPELGVSNEELTAAYASIASGGVYLEPIYYISVWDGAGDELLAAAREGRTAMKDTTAFLLTSGMQEAVEKASASGIRLKDVPVAGQVGLSDSGNSSWCMAFTPEYTCGILSGFDDGTLLEEGDYTMRIWSQIMEQINQDAPKAFPIPAGIRQMKICLLSGKNAINGVCGRTYVEYYASGTESSEMCDLHETAVICSESGLLAGKYCPEELLEQKVYEKDAENPAEQMPTDICNIHTGKNAGEK